MVKGREGVETERLEMRLHFQCQWTREPARRAEMKTILEHRSGHRPSTSLPGGDITERDAPPADCHTSICSQEEGDAFLESELLPGVVLTSPGHTGESQGGGQEECG